MRDGKEEPEMQQFWTREGTAVDKKSVHDDDKKEIRSNSRAPNNVSISNGELDDCTVFQFPTFIFVLSEGHQKSRCAFVRVCVELGALSRKMVVRKGNKRAEELRENFQLTVLCLEIL